MTEPFFATLVERDLARSRKRRRTIILLIILAGFLALIASFLTDKTYYFESEEDHFKYGSIGAETRSGLPLKFWDALPELYPEKFGVDGDYGAFGFLYDDTRPDADLPIGISKRRRFGIDLVWFNCAVCHTGAQRSGVSQTREIIAGMPANNLRLGEFTEFLLSTANDDVLESDKVFEAMERGGKPMGLLERSFWRIFVMPRVRSELKRINAALIPLMDRQPEWGTGRVDTFNPYKVNQLNMDVEDIEDAAVIGASDFPPIFMQGPREGMQLHWDGNNRSLKERNLSASLGAGVFPDTVDHKSVERVAAWLLDLPTPVNPAKPSRKDMSQAMINGKNIYGKHCFECHGGQGKKGYIFKGKYLGKVTPIDEIQTDRRRLDSYTEEFKQLQLSRLFAGTPYQFKEFEKTNGYANAPLDGLWLRGPFLHNGSVPTLKDLLSAESDRPTTFTRGSDVIDRINGGFQSAPCEENPQDFCFDTRLAGNNNSGHNYGTMLEDQAKNDLLEYLKTF